VSVRLSVCPVDRQRQQHAAGLLLINYLSMSAACRRMGAGSRYRSIAACAGARAAASVIGVIRGGSTRLAAPVCVLSYRVTGVDGSCAKHLTVESYAANSCTYYYY